VDSVEAIMMRTESSVHIDDVVLALEQRKLKPAASMLREVLAQPSSYRGQEDQIAQLAERVAHACLEHGAERDAAAIYRLLLCEDCGLHALPGDAATATRSKLLQTLVILGQATPASARLS